MGIGEQHDCITHRVKLHMYVHVQCIHEVTRGIKAVCQHVYTTHCGTVCTPYKDSTAVLCYIHNRCLVTLSSRRESPLHF